MDSKTTENIGCVSWLTGSYMNSLVGKKMTNANVWSYVISDKKLDVEDNFTNFQAHWQHEQKLLSLTSDKDTQKRKPSLTRALWRTFRKEILTAAFLKLGWGFFILFSLTFFVRELLKAITCREKPSEDYVGKDFQVLNAYNTSWVLCCFLWLSCIFLSICLQQMSATSSRLGLRVKLAVSTSVYRKTLTHNKYLSKTDIVSLVAMDCNKLGEACTTLQFLWSGILESVAITAVLLGLIGKAALPGAAIMLLLLPFQYFTGVAISRMRKRVVKASDARVNLMDEILCAIKLVKMYAWERKFSENVENLRSQETHLALIGAFLKSMNLTGVLLLPPLLGLSIFAVYELEKPLDNALAFTTLSLFNTLRLPLVRLPNALRSLGEAISSCERIQDFLLCADRELKPRAENIGIVFDKACFTYGASQTAVLRNVTINIQKGTLAMVAGPVGSGKSNFLQAIMGGMTRLTGSESVGGEMAYVPQSPWCCHGTVRDNILFGKPYDEKFYKQVLFACALETDLTLMENGDATQIGERGMNLSGGQKQRIALARAAYSGADIYLLDAPLSAVDMYTCGHIFQHCIMGIMMGRAASVVLVTHQVELFVHATVLAVMKDGTPQYVGPYDPKSIQKFFPQSRLTETTTLVVEGKNKAVSETIARQVSGESPEVFLRQASGKGSHSAPSKTGEQFPRQASGKSNADGKFTRQASGSDALNPVGPVKTRAKEARAEILQHAKTDVAIQVPKEDKPAAKTSKGINPFFAFAIEMRLYLVFIAVSIFVVSQVVRIYSDVWVSAWVRRAYADQNPNFYVGVYGGFVIAFAILLFMRAMFFFWMGGRAASRMHRKMFNSMLKAPMSFFTVTPLGNVLNSFSKDMDCIDEQLLDEIHNLLFDGTVLGTVIGVVIGVLPLFAIVVAVLGISFCCYFYWYMSTSRVLKEVAGASSSAVVANVSETLQGMDVIQAYKAEDRFRIKSRLLMTNSSSVDFNLEMLRLWLCFRMDFIACLLLLITCLLAVGITDLPASSAGLAVSNSFQILVYFAQMVLIASDMANHISSVSRVVGLSKIEPEPDLPLSIETCPAAQWPAYGEVNFYNVVMSYAPGLPAILKGVSVTIERSEKVGVAGRTGAGKSTLIMAIFRLANVTSGSVHIDGMDISKLTLAELRRRIAIIPQEPVMFSGSLKINLDPFGERPDQQLIHALESCLLNDLITSHPDGLNRYVAHKGANFSLGQQQLICLARAMLNPSKLLLLDEATAALDSDTDAAVQRVLRTNFADRTTVTIAHRLDTIIDSDKILVMDAGRVAEFDSPYNLLNNATSIFAELCRKTGDQYETLRAAAERHHLCTQAFETRVEEEDYARGASGSAQV